jgi:hypothetical protein
MFQNIGNKEAIYNSGCDYQLDSEEDVSVEGLSTNPENTATPTTTTTTTVADETEKGKEKEAIKVDILEIRFSSGGG